MFCCILTSVVGLQHRYRPDHFLERWILASVSPAPSAEEALHDRDLRRQVILFHELRRHQDLNCHIPVENPHVIVSPCSPYSLCRTLHFLELNACLIAAPSCRYFGRGLQFFFSHRHLLPDHHASKNDARRFALSLVLPFLGKHTPHRPNL